MVPRDTNPITQAAFDLIVELRGGLPDKCDFCGQPYTVARYPVPEEASAWACIECERRWMKEDQSKT